MSAIAVETRDPRRAGQAGLDDRLQPAARGSLALAARTGHGEVHAGFRVAAFGWIPSILHDPAGHDVRFYTVRHHREPHRDDVLLADGPGEIARRRAAELGAR